MTVVSEGPITPLIWERSVADRLRHGEILRGMSDDRAMVIVYHTSEEDCGTPCGRYTIVVEGDGQFCDLTFGEAREKLRRLGYRGFG